MSTKMDPYKIKIPITDVRSISNLKTAKMRTFGANICSIPVLKPCIKFPVMDQCVGGRPP